MRRDSGGKGGRGGAGAHSTGSEPALSAAKGQARLTNGAVLGLSNGRQTVAIMLSFALLMFVVIGWVWNSLDNRMARCEQQVVTEVSVSVAQRATVDVRLANIEKQVEEIRQDVKVMRERM